MKSCILIQCFIKVKETIQVLESLMHAECIDQYDIICYVDKAEEGSKFESSNLKLVQELLKFKEKYKDHPVILEFAKKNLGPYLCCYQAMEFCFTNYDFVIFSEDDSIFCKDTIRYYNFYRDHQIKDEKDVLGITSMSGRYPRKNLEPIDPLVLQKIKEFAIKEGYINKYQKVFHAPNKQFGIFKDKWQLIRHLRCQHHADHLTLQFIQDHQYYFYFSVIPRTNDIGLNHELCCSTLYFGKEIPVDTMNIITSDDFYPTSLNSMEIYWD